jgi:hypothetical protein
MISILLIFYKIDFICNKAQFSFASNFHEFPEENLPYSYHSMWSWLLQIMTTVSAAHHRQLITAHWSLITDY